VGLKTFLKIVAKTFFYVNYFSYISSVIIKTNTVNKRIQEVEDQLHQIVVSLRMEGLYSDNLEGESLGYLLNKGTAAADFLIDATPSEREFILHKLAPGLMIEDVYENNHIILKLK